MMEIVEQFHGELTSLYQVKPPISKAKMSQITRVSMKGVKMYKHIVQAVEKFIEKCHPEYKIPGLYLIDSIVRQSRHQFGPEKDVFAPRFARNFPRTFQNLFLTCPPDDKPKIVRVLNLWQRNKVFSAETIQPLLDMANPNAPLAQMKFESSPKDLNQDNNNQAKDQSVQGNKDATLILQLQHLASSLAQGKGLADSIGGVIGGGTGVGGSESVKFNKKLLDFDYGDDEEDDERGGETPTESEPMIRGTLSQGQEQTDQLVMSMAQNLLSNPELLQQLQQMHQSIQQTELLKDALNLNDKSGGQLTGGQQAAASFISSFQSINPNDLASQLQEQQVNLANFQITNELMDQMMMIQNQNLNSNVLNMNNLNNLNSNNTIQSQFNSQSVSSVQSSLQPNNSLTQSQASQLQLQQLQSRSSEQQFNSNSNNYNSYTSYGVGQQASNDGQQPYYYQSTDDNRDRNDRDGRDRSARRSRSKSPRRGSRYRRSRSRSPRRRGERDRRYRSPDRQFDQRQQQQVNLLSRPRSPGSIEREKERERRRRGLPPIRKGYLTICSTTLWLGHVPKLVSEADLSDAFGEFGTINSIDVIPSRGCAYVCMNRRQDASKALQQLKNMKLHGSVIKMAWAPGKGMKGKEYKDYWEVDHGSSYIPYDKIPDDVDLDLLEEGGMIDEETVPEKLQELRKLKNKEKEAAQAAMMANAALMQMPIGVPFAVPGMVMPNLIISQAQPPTPTSIATMSVVSTTTGMPLVPPPPPNESSQSSDTKSNNEMKISENDNKIDEQQQTSLIQVSAPALLPFSVPPPPIPSNSFVPLQGGPIGQPWLPPGPSLLGPGPGSQPNLRPPLIQTPPVSTSNSFSDRKDDSRQPLLPGLPLSLHHRDEIPPRHDHQGGGRFIRDRSLPYRRPGSPRDDDPFAPSVYELRAMNRGPGLLGPGPGGPPLIHPHHHGQMHGSPLIKERFPFNDRRRFGREQNQRHFEQNQRNFDGNQRNFDGNQRHFDNPHHHQTNQRRDFHQDRGNRRRDRPSRWKNNDNFNNNNNSTGNQLNDESVESQFGSQQSQFDSQQFDSQEIKDEKITDPSDQQESFQQESFQHESFQHENFQQESFQQESFQQESFQQDSFHQESFHQDDVKEECDNQAPDDQR